MNTEENEGDFNQVYIVSQTIPTEQNEAQSSFGFVSDRTFKTLTNDGQSDNNKKPTSQRQINEDRLHAPMIMTKSQQSNQSDDHVDGKEGNEPISKRKLLSKMDEFTKDLASSKKSRKGSQQSTPGSNYGRNSANSRRKQLVPISVDHQIEHSKHIELQKEEHQSSNMMKEDEQLQQVELNAKHELIPATSTPVLEFQNTSFNETLRIEEAKPIEISQNIEKLNENHFPSESKLNNQLIDQLQSTSQEQCNNQIQIAQTSGFPQSILDDEDMKDLTLTRTEEGTGLMKRAIQLQAVLQSLQSPTMSGKATPIQNMKQQQMQQTQEFCEGDQVNLNNIPEVKVEGNVKDEFQHQIEQHHQQYHYHQNNENLPQLIAKNRVMDLKHQLAEIRRSQQQQEQFAKKFAQDILMDDSSSLSESEQQFKQHDYEVLEEYPIQVNQIDSLEIHQDDALLPYEDQYSGENASNIIYQQLHQDNQGTTVHYMSAHPQLQRATQSLKVKDYERKEDYKYRPPYQPSQNAVFNYDTQHYNSQPQKESKYKYQEANKAKPNMQHVQERFKHLKLNNSSSQQSFNQFATGVSQQMSTKFSVLKNVIEQSFAQQRAASLTSKSIQQPQSSQEFNSVSALTNKKNQLTAQSPSMMNCQSRASYILQPVYSSALTNNHYQSQASSVSNDLQIATLKNGNCNLSLENENAMLKQQIKVLTQNEKILLKQIEKQQRKAGKERERWEEQMRKMQDEVSQLNNIITKMMSEKNRKLSLKCECRPRIRDLERQIIDCHRQLYFAKRGMSAAAESELSGDLNNQVGVESQCINNSGLARSLVRDGNEDITPKPEPNSSAQRKILLNRDSCQGIASNQDAFESIEQPATHQSMEVLYQHPQKRESSKSHTRRKSQSRSKSRTQEKQKNVKSRSTSHEKKRTAKEGDLSVLIPQAINFNNNKAATATKQASKRINKQKREEQDKLGLQQALRRPSTAQTPIGRENKVPFATKTQQSQTTYQIKLKTVQASGTK